MYVIVTTLRAYGPFATGADATAWAIPKTLGIGGSFSLFELVQVEPNRDSI